MHIHFACINLTWTKPPEQPGLHVPSQMQEIKWYCVVETSWAEDVSSNAINPAQESGRCKVKRGQSLQQPLSIIVFVLHALMILSFRSGWSENAELLSGGLFLSAVKTNKSPRPLLTVCTTNCLEYKKKEQSKISAGLICNVVTRKKKTKLSLFYKIHPVCFNTCYWSYCERFMQY